MFSYKTANTLFINNVYTHNILGKPTTLMKLMKPGGGNINNKIHISR